MVLIGTSLIQNGKTAKYNMNRKRKFDFPANYNQTNITYEIPSFSDADRDGNVEECF
jgi:hypothetical protein